ncbi:MAG TPA: ABC transporter substrate-binding protein [Ktedonobacterales bacterium]|nr:ABC transporter substrate-binding protein [Ktedonobacterales bacterium]
MFSRPHKPATGRFWAAGASLAALSALLLAGCGGGGAATATGTQVTGPKATSTVNCSSVNASGLHLVTSGTLTIASDTTYAPAEFVDPSNPNQYDGYDMDLVREMARRLCLTPKIVSASFGTIVSGISGPPLGQQPWDTSISSFTINSSRAQLVDFIPYFVAGESTLVAKGNPQHIASVADFCGKTVSAQNATIELQELKALNGQNIDPNTEGIAQPATCKSNPMTILSYDSEEDVITQVINGRAVASYQDQPVTDYYISLNAGKLDPGFIVPTSQGTEGIVVRKDNAALETAMKTVLANMVADGSYQSIMAKWGQTKLACLAASGGCPPSS